MIKGIQMSYVCKLAKEISRIKNIELMLNSYGAAMVGVATAETPCGPYTYKGSFKPLGADSRDESIFQDGEICHCCALLNVL